jgi:pimeloyl-ACP methyl ester carboxylesterase
VMADCLADRDCHAAFPEPQADLERFLARFTAGASSITIRHPRTYRPVSLTLSRDIAMDIVRGALYVPKDAATVMQLVRQAADGDFAPLLAQYVRTASLMTDDVALGATMSVLCSEDLPSVAKTDFTAAAEGSRFGSAYADTWRSRCAAWQAGQALGEPVDAVSQAPALILSGGHDPVTPPRAGELMTRHFPRHRHIVVEHAAHNASFSGCVPDLIATFIADGHGEALDDRCAGDVAWPPFVVGTSGTLP